jgi:hypothetical protein
MSKPTDRFSPSIPIANPKPAGGPVKPGNYPKPAPERQLPSIGGR